MRTEDDPDTYRLVRGEKTVGHVWIKAPEDAAGQALAATAPSFLVNSPVTGIPTACIMVGFRAGSAPGDYIVTFKLNDGTSSTMFVRVP